MIIPKGIPRVFAAVALACCYLAMNDAQLAAAESVDDRQTALWVMW